MTLVYFNDMGWSQIEDTLNYSPYLSLNMSYTINPQYLRNSCFQL